MLRVLAGALVALAILAGAATAALHPITRFSGSNAEWNRAHTDVVGLQAKKGGVLRIGSENDVDSVDPALADLPISWMVENATCAKLFNNPDASGAAGAPVIPEVVDHWARSPNRKTYTFDLRKTFRFQTGAPVTAQSFADAFNRDANPVLQSPAMSLMHEIVGADAVAAGRTKTISGVRVLSRYRLQIQLTRPLGDFLARLTTPFFCPILPDTPSSPAGSDSPAGSGPYYVASRFPNRQIVLERNPYYRGGRSANVDGVVLTVGESRDACLADIAQDRIDYCTPVGVPPSSFRDVAARYGINKKDGQFFVNPSPFTLYFAFNHDRPAFKGAGQIPLEKAINYAIDRRALAGAYGFEAGKRTDQMLPSVLGPDESIYPLTADPTTARRWLAKAKHKPTRLVLYASNSTTGTLAAQFFAFEMSKIGIVVDIRFFTSQILFQKTATRGEPFDVAYNGWTGGYVDPAAFLEPLLDGRNLGATGNTDISYLDDASVNARIDTANGLTGQARRDAWAALDVDLMRHDPPWAPFLQLNNRDFVSPSFGCFVSNLVIRCGHRRCLQEVAPPLGETKTMTSLPRGTVTLLFSDVEGSTELQHRLGDHYQEVVETLRRLLEAAFAAHGGTVVDRQTESFFCVFTRAQHAVQAAATAQRALAVESWPMRAQVRVRMGIHAGDPEVAGDRYIGLAVSRAARICAAAHGGQVLLSSSARSLLADHDRAALLDLGLHRLKDFPEPESLSQLTIEGLPTRFPPLRTEAQPPSRRRPLLVAAAALLSIAGIAAVVFTVTSSGGSGLSHIGATSVGVIDAKTNELVAEVPLGFKSSLISSGEGSIWVANPTARTLTKINPRTRKIDKTFGGFPIGTITGIAAGKGAVWVGGISGNGRQLLVLELDPEFGSVKNEIPLEHGATPYSPAANPVRLAVSPNAVWVLEQGLGKVRRIDPTLAKPSGTVEGIDGFSIAATRTAVWLGGRTGVTRIDPETDHVLEPVHVSGVVTSATMSITTGASGVWFVGSSQPTLFRISPSANAVANTSPVGAGPSGVAVGDGAVWVANSRDGTVSRVDPDGSVDTVRLGSPPGGIVVYQGQVWTSPDEPAS